MLGALRERVRELDSPDELAEFDPRAIVQRAGRAADLDLDLAAAGLAAALEFADERPVQRAQFGAGRLEIADRPAARRDDAPELRLDLDRHVRQPLRDFAEGSRVGLQFRAPRRQGRDRDRGQLGHHLELETAAHDLARLRADAPAGDVDPLGPELTRDPAETVDERPELVPDQRERLAHVAAAGPRLGEQVREHLLQRADRAAEIVHQSDDAVDLAERAKPRGGHGFGGAAGAREVPVKMFEHPCLAHD